MFYCITILKNNVYYDKSLDAIAIVKYQDKQLHLLDVFSKSEKELELIIDSLSNGNIDSVLLGFTPKNTSSFEVRIVDEKSKDEVLFVQTGKTELFDENKLMLPLLSHA